MNTKQTAAMNRRQHLTCPKCGKEMLASKGSLVSHIRWCGDDPVARFWSKIDDSNGQDACWPWLGAKHRDGYGRGRATKRGSIAIAHRLAYKLTKGEIPASLDVLHSCDNRICCNPSHLYLGTHRDNMIDMRQKGRCSRQVFTAEQVRAARKLLPTMGNQDLAKHLGVRHDAIWRLRHGKTYQWVDESPYGEQERS